MSGMTDERSELGARVGREPAPRPTWDDLPDVQPSEEDATRLAVAAQRGDPRAQESLVERLLPLVVRIARSYQVEGLDFADLVQEGIVGLLRALRRYEPERAPFVAYATWWIRQGLQELRSDFMRPFRLPPRAVRQLSQLKSEHGRVWATERREPTLRELADRLGMELEQVDALVRADAATRLLSEPVQGTEGEVGILGELIADPISAEAYEEVLDSITGTQVRGLLGRLTEREREIVDARFGFGEKEPQRLVEIGERLGVSAERVRQIEERALAKLRRMT